MKRTLTYTLLISLTAGAPVGRASQQYLDQASYQAALGAQGIADAGVPAVVSKIYHDDLGDWLPGDTSNFERRRFDTGSGFNASLGCFSLPCVGAYSVTFTFAAPVQAISGLLHYNFYF